MDSNWYVRSETNGVLNHLLELTIKTCVRANERVLLSVIYVRSIALTLVLY